MARVLLISQEAAIQAEKEKVLYVIAVYTGTGIEEPDYLATVDVDPDSPTYSLALFVAHLSKLKGFYRTYAN